MGLADIVRTAGRRAAVLGVAGTLLFSPVNGYGQEREAQRDTENISIENALQENVLEKISDEDQQYITALRELEFSDIQIDNLFQDEVSLDFIQELYSMKTQEDERLFENNDIIRLTKINRTEEELKAYVNSAIAQNKELDGFTISRLCQLDVGIENIYRFEDTIRQNMLYIAPRADHNGAFENKASIDIYQRLAETYDTYTVIASEEDDVYEALDKVPDIALVLLGGHGSMTTLQLGENEFYDEKVREFYENKPSADLDIRDWNEYDYERVDRHLIDVRDDELQQHTENLRDDTVIFMNSCLNGKGGRTKANLANYFMEHMISNFPDSTVYASTRSFSAYDVQIRNTLPFNIQIAHLNHGNPFGMFDSVFANTTYSNKDEDYYNTDSKMLTEPYNRTTESED